MKNFVRIGRTIIDVNAITAIGDNGEIYTIAGHRHYFPDYSYEEILSLLGFETDLKVKEELLDLVQAGRIIDAIKKYRTWKKADLLEAKTAIENLRDFGTFSRPNTLDSGGSTDSI